MINTSTTVIEFIAAGVTSPPPGLLLGTSLGQIRYALLGVFLAASVIAVVSRSRRKDPMAAFPWVNTSKEVYFRNGRALVEQGRQMYGEQPFRVHTGLGKGVLVMSPEYTSEIKNDKRFLSSEVLLQYWQAGVPGFEPYICLGSELTHDVIKQHLTTQNMTKFAEPLSQETSAALQDILTDSEDWHEIRLSDAFLHITARIASRVFLGAELCRDPDWIHLTTTYTAKATAAARVLRGYPSCLTYIVHWFLPECQELRVMVKRARGVIDPILRRRALQQKQNPSAEFQDGLQWYENMVRKKGIKKFHPAHYQLGLFIGAGLTSTDLVSQHLIDLCRTPELLEPLRQEVREVVGQGTWNSTTLHNLRLMDSALKETLRLKPVACLGLGRLVATDVVLKRNNLFLPKGASIAVSSERMWDAAVYQEPFKYDAYRFLRRREEAQESGEEDPQAQLVSTSNDHMGFGVGTHSCPGRFFGANSVKLLMCHLLLKYEFRIPEDTDVNPLRFGFSMLANPQTKLLVRRRKEQVSF